MLDFFGQKVEVKIEKLKKSVKRTCCPGNCVHDCRGVRKVSTGITAARQSVVNDVLHTRPPCIVAIIGQALLTIWKSSWFVDLLVHRSYMFRFDWRQHCQVVAFLFA